MENTRIKDEIMKQARKDGQLIVTIAGNQKRHYGTIQRWFYDNSPMLLNVDVLSTIANHYGKTVSEITEKSLVKA